MYFKLYNLFSTDTVHRFKHEPRAVFRTRPRLGSVDFTLGMYKYTPT